MLSTDDNGRVLVEELEPGRYMAHLNSAERGLTTPVELVLELHGENPQPARLVLPRGAAVYGEVHAASAFPTYQVRAIAVPGPPTAQTITDPDSRGARIVDGRYDLAGLAQGRYRLVLEGSSGIGRMPGGIVWFAQSEVVVDVDGREDRRVDFPP
jgi:hypothetical protein